MSPVRFALSFSGPQISQQQERVRRLLIQTDSTDHMQLARAHTILAAALLISDPAGARTAAAASAHEAELAGDPISKAWSLLAACVVDLSCGATTERLRMTEQILQTTRGHAADEVVTPAYFLHLAALTELADTGGLDRALGPAGPILSAFPQLAYGRHAAWFRCLRATLDGQVATAAKLAGEALLIAQQEQDPDAQSVWLGQIAIIRWMQGQVVELEPAFLSARQRAPHEPIWAASLAWIWLRQGRKSAARGLLSSFADVAAMPLDRNWLATACILAEVAVSLDDLSIAAKLREALVPFQNRLATIGLGVTCWGTVARPLALLTAALGDLDAAVGYYRRAIRIAARTGVHYWLAEAQSELAALLLRRDRPEDLPQAQALVAEAAATGRALQLHGVERLANTVIMPPQQTGAWAEVGSAEHRRLPTVRVLGTFEVITTSGVVARWQSRKARQLLKILVARRGVPISRESVMHMMWPDEQTERVANRFAVAASTVRRILEPEGAPTGNSFIESRDGMIRLRVDEMDIDVERFLNHSTQALKADPDSPHRMARLAEALRLYRGDPMADEADEPWAEELCRDVHIALFATAHALAETAGNVGDQLTRMESYRKILALDQYDQRAHEGLIDALTALGAHGQADTARLAYYRSMDLLGIPVESDAGVRSCNGR